MQTRRAALTPLAALLAATLASADEAATAKQVLQASGLRAGLCVHVGCGRSESAGLTAALAESPAWFVHGLAFDDAALARARKAIEAKGVAGRAMAEKLEAAPLPYLPDLANLVVVEDLASLSAKGVTKEDLLRVVAPEGALCVREGGTWKKTPKPRPKEMDVWSHTYHGADGNLVSNDRAVKFPIGFRWIEGLPVNLNQWAACRGWIVMNGRCYALSSNEPENLPPSRTRDHYLSARDAFNGLPLWKVNLGTTDNGAFLTWRNAASLAADEKRVYAPAKEKAIAADADTGKIVATYATKYPPVRLVLLDKTLVVTSWEDREPTKLKYEGESLWATWVPKTDNGTVEAFDAESGKPKWSLPYPANQVLAADGTVYLISQKGNPPTERFVAAVDLKTGKERWRQTHTSFGEDPDLQLNCAGAGWVVIAKRRGKDKENTQDRRAIHVLAAADGKTLWSISPAGATWTPVVDGLLWHGSKKYDPKTGEVKGSIGTGIPDQGCTPSSIIGASILSHSRGCGYVEIPPEGKGGAKGVQYGGARGGCMEGMIAANGMLYTSQNNCRCAPGQIYGFLGIGPVGDLPGSADFEGPRPVEKGPAAGSATAANTDAKPGAEAGTADDWPTFRHDAERTAATAVKLPDGLKEAWKAQVVTPPSEGLLAAAWTARLASPVTAPVVAGGRVCVAGSDTGQVVALDAATGKKLWSTLLGGRVDTPPTIHRGLCLVGSHDGWAYALRAKDGQIAWRTRVAPRERRLAAYGEVESVWPAVGTVLVHDGTAYANAGRTAESDGGIAVVALDPATGETRWAKALGPGGKRMNDLLCLRGDAIAWHHLRLDPKTGAPKPPAAEPKDPSQGGMLDGTWTRVGKRRSGNAFVLGKMSADLLAWDGALAAAPGLALSREKAEAGSVKEAAWRPALPNNTQVEAIALAGNAVVYAVRAKDPKPGEPQGSVCVFAAADGKKVAEFPLEAAPTYDGLAVAKDRIVVSLWNGSVACFGK